MTTLQTALYQKQMEDLLASVPDQAQLRVTSALRCGQRVYATRGKTVYMYKGDKHWECILDGDVQV